MGGRSKSGFIEKGSDKCGTEEPRNMFFLFPTHIPETVRMTQSTYTAVFAAVFLSHRIQHEPQLPWEHVYFPILP